MTSYPGMRMWLGAVALSFACGPAFAHIKNEASQFPDIEYSEARFDIVVLVGAGIIPETPVFEPDKALSKREVAAWAALALGLAEAGETPDTDALAKAAIDQGILDSLEGEATYADLNALFFDARLPLEAAGQVPTKAEAASFIASKLGTDAGRALLDRRGIRTGGTGEVMSVDSKEGHHGGSAYVITVGDASRQMHEHGRVANGPIDLLQWQGRQVRRSFVVGEGEHVVWIYLEADPLETTAAEASDALPAAEAAAEPAPSDRRLLYGLVVGVVVLGVLLFFRRRRSN